MTKAAVQPRGLRVKVCGFTDVSEAVQAVAAGVDSIGLNFYERSPRFLQLEVARSIRQAVGERATVVGVFVDTPFDRIAEIVERVGLDVVQLHGRFTQGSRAQDLAPGLAHDGAPAGEWGGRIMPVVRLAPGDDGAELAERLAGCGRLWGVLFDAPGPLGHGGAGRPWDWSQAARLVAGLPHTAFWLAGGLRPDNVALAVATVPGLAGVDVCSGVESAAGRKDIEKVRAFVAAVRSCAAAARHGDETKGRGNQP